MYYRTVTFKNMKIYFQTEKKKQVDNLEDSK